MSSVVDNNVELLRVIFSELFPKRRVPLVTNYNANAVLFKLLAVGIYVDSYVTVTGKENI